VTGLCTGVPAPEETRGAQAGHAGMGPPDMTYGGPPVVVAAWPALAVLELDHIVAVALRPDVGQAVVDVAVVADVDPRHLVVLELDVVGVGGISGIGEADEAAGLDNEEIIGPMDVCSKGRAGCER